MEEREGKEIKREEHKYFISYFYGEGLGKGNAEIKTQKKIEGMEEIREIERLIEDRERVRRVVIITFREY